MNDFRYALRTLRRSTGVATVAITSLALGIGATTAIFSFTNAVILRSLPVQKPNELVLLRYASKKGNIFDTLGFEDYRALRDAPEVLTGLAAVSTTKMNLASEEATERVPGQLVSGNYFPLLGVRPRIGRLIAPEDDRLAGGHPVCVISYGLWQSRFGSAPGVVGRNVEINGRPYTILGVTPAGFDGTEQGTRAQLYVPLAMAAQIISSPPELNLVGRRKAAVTLAQAQAVLDSRFSALPIAKQEFTFESSNRHTTPGPRSRLLVVDGKQGFDNLRFGYERPLLFLLFLVGLLLLIACANVASLLVARASGQRKQIAIRLALGASRWALVRQQLAESILLALGGAAGGLLLSVWISDLLLGLAPESRQIDVRPDFAVLGFLLAVAVLTVLLFGIAPALESGKAGVGPVLKTDSTGGGRRRGALAGTLVVIQVALSITLLVGAGLLLRSLHNLQSIPMGFQPENVAVATINTSVNHYKPERTHALLEDLMQRAESIHGVRAVSAALVSPLSGSLWLYSVDVAGYPARPKEVPMTYMNAVGPGYFATIGEALVRGREFTRADREGGPYVAVVNEQFAKKFWPGRDPIGQRFKTAALDGNEAEVIGVVRDSIYRDVREAKQEILYVPLLQGDFGSATLHLRVSGDPAPVFNQLRAQARAADPAVPLYGMRTLNAQIGETLSTERMLATVSTILGALAIVLAMVGLYSVLANAVAQRTREIGIRMALGAARTQVIGMVMRDTLRMVFVGVLVGIPVSLAASRWIASFLYGIKSQDPLTYIAIATLVVAAGLAAAYGPSRRASRVDPMVVLRYD
ncbi:MAG: ABC transporter permease [Bryobacteraceae bacterium]|jgi:predicted permease